MRFKIDENLPAGLVELLRGGGHDVHTVADESMRGADDANVLAAGSAMADDGA